MFREGDVGKEMSREYLDFAMNTLQSATDNSVATTVGETVVQQSMSNVLQSDVSSLINTDSEGCRMAYEALKEILSEYDPQLKYTGEGHWMCCALLVLLDFCQLISMYHFRSTSSYESQWKTWMGVGC